MTRLTQDDDCRFRSASSFLWKKLSAFSVRCDGGGGVCDSFDEIRTTNVTAVTSTSVWLEKWWWSKLYHCSDYPTDWLTDWVSDCPFQFSPSRSEKAQIIIYYLFSSFLPLPLHWACFALFNLCISYIWSRLTEEVFRGDGCRVYFQLQNTRSETLRYNRVPFWAEIRI